jgi:hypothetical protein
MKLDTSDAPELAFWTVPAQPAPEGEVPGVTTPATVGYLAACLRILVAAPQSWWDRVRFDPGGPAHIAVSTPGLRCEAWLLVLPPGYRGDGPRQERNWEVARLVAGEMAEQIDTAGEWRTRPLPVGRTRVCGQRGLYPMINTGTGYAVCLLARKLPAREPSSSPLTTPHKKH